RAPSSIASRLEGRSRRVADSYGILMPAMIGGVGKRRVTDWATARHPPVIARRILAGRSTRPAWRSAQSSTTTMPDLNRSQAYEQSDDAGRNPTSSSTLGDIIAQRYGR